MFNSKIASNVAFTIIVTPLAREVDALEPPVPHLE